MENELEKLIVRLVGDPTLYIKALSQAAQETTKASGQIESSLRRIEQSMAQNMGRASQNVVNSLKQGTDSVQAFTGQVKAFGQALTGALAFAGIGNGLRDILGLFDKYETTMIGLEAALETNGDAVDSTIEQYKRFADHISEVTTQGNLATMGMLRMATAYGQTGDAAQQLVTSSMALARASSGGLSPEHMMRVVMALKEGRTEMLRTIPELRMIHDESERLARANQLVQTGLKVMAKEADTVSGRMQMIKNSMQSVGVEMGATMSEFLKPFVQGLQALVKWFRELDPTVKKVITTLVLITSGFAMFGTLSFLLAPLISSLLGMARTILGFLSPLKLLQVAFFLTFSPIAWLIGGIIAAIGVLIYKAGGIAEAWNILKEKSTEVWQGIKKAIESFWEWAKPIIQSLADLFLSVGEVVLDTMSGFWETLKQGFSQLSSFLSGIWTGITGDATVSWEQVRQVVMGAIQMVWRSINEIRDTLVQVWDAVKPAVLTMWDTVKQAFENAKNLVQKVWEDVLGDTQVTWQSIKETIQNAMQVAKDIIVTASRAIAAVITFLVEMWGRVENAVISVFGEIWEYVKTVWSGIAGDTSSVWDTIKGIILGAVEIIQAYWGFISDAAKAAWDLIAEIISIAWYGAIKPIIMTAVDVFISAWNAIFGSANVNWTGIKDAIVNTLIMAQFVVRNFKAIMEMTWLGIKMEFVAAWNEIHYTITEALPAALDWLSRNWHNVFRDMANFVINIFQNLAENASTFIRNIFTGGGIDFSSLTANLTRGWQSSITEGLVLPPRVMGEVERQLREEFQQSSRHIGEDFQEFRRRRLAEIAQGVSGANPLSGVPNMIRAAFNSQAIHGASKQAGLEVGEAFSGGIEKGMQKWEAAAFGSAEALHRIEAYRDRMKGVIGGLPNGPQLDNSQALSEMSTIASASNNLRTEIERPITPQFNISPGLSSLAQLARAGEIASASILAAVPPTGAVLPGGATPPTTASPPATAVPRIIAAQQALGAATPAATVPRGLAEVQRAIQTPPSDSQNQQGWVAVQLASQQARPPVRLPGLAVGGITTKPIAAIVGERGPEAVIPLSQMSKVMGDISSSIPEASSGTASAGAQMMSEIGQQISVTITPILNEAGLETIRSQISDSMGDMPLGASMSNLRQDNATTAAESLDPLLREISSSMNMMSASVAGLESATGYGVPGRAQEMTPVGVPSASAPIVNINDQPAWAEEMLVQLKRIHAAVSDRTIRTPAGTTQTAMSASLS